MDLSESAVTAFWRGVSPLAVDVVHAMDAADAWTVDGDPTVEPLMLRVVDQMTTESFAKAPDEALVRFASLVRSSRALRLLQSCGNQDAQLLARWTDFSLRVLARDSSSRLDRALAQVFISRIQTVRCQLLLSTAFSPAAIKNAILLIARNRAAGAIP